MERTSPKGTPIVAQPEASKHFAAFMALDGVSLAISADECVRLVDHFG